MEGPRSPAEAELSRVIEFLNGSLREGTGWSIATEYPTALASSNLHNMRIITEAERVVSHAVIKPLVIKSPQVIYKVAAIGSVVTDPSRRNQGLSTKILNDCLAEATRQQCDIAILWTNMHDFYRRLGFELAGREISLVMDHPLNVPPGGLRFSDDNKVSAEAIHRLFAAHTVGSTRSVDDIRKFLAIPKTKIYTAWEPDGALAAFAVEGKGADLGGYLHEWGGGVTKLLALLSWIKARRQDTLTLIAPAHSQNLIAQLAAKGALVNQGYLGMIKILCFEQLAAKVKRAYRAGGLSDVVFEQRGAQFLFGVGTELFTLTDEADMTRLLFGPVDINDLDMFSEAARQKLARLLPLPLWLWGWDSV